MSNKSATQRREEKLAKKLSVSAVNNHEQLKITWGWLLNCWILEAIRRGKRLQQEPDPVGEKEAVLRKEDFLRGKKLDPYQPDPERDVYGILAKAERMFKLCDPEVERLLGAETRDLLNHNCAKAVALAVDPNMYHLSVKLHEPKPRKKKVARTNPSTST